MTLGAGDEAVLAAGRQYAWTLCPWSLFRCHLLRVSSDLTQGKSAGAALACRETRDGHHPRRVGSAVAWRLLVSVAGAPRKHGRREVCPRLPGEGTGSRGAGVRRRGGGYSGERVPPPPASRSLLLPTPHLPPAPAAPTPRDPQGHQAPSRWPRPPSLKAPRRTPACLLGLRLCPRATRPRCSYITRVLPHPHAALSSKSPHLLDVGV